ncbi:hypothetical protein ABLG96_12000 [Nakamurella sp. A5-74]|uniref:Lipoprotein n=1 Tax=Nakamurella sp. A5-74 TaxID=3158264 RepID=A0AAU8DJ78_9ACTN
MTNRTSGRGPVRNGAIGGVLLLLIGLLDGCSDRQTIELGSLFAFGDGHSTVCIPALRDATDVAFGFDALNNTGDSPLSITHVELVDSVGLNVAGSYVVPLPPHDALIGVSAGWPLSASRTAEIPGWDLSKYTDGVVPAANTSADVYNLLIHLQISAALPATFSAMRIEYTYHDDSFYQNTAVGLRVAAEC